MILFISKNSVLCILSPACEYLKTVNNKVVVKSSKIKIHIFVLQALGPFLFK